MIRISLASLVVAAAIATPAPHAFAQGSGSDAERAALARTGDAIRAAFAAGDAEAVVRYHHPDVEKWLGHSNHVVGRDVLRAGLVETFKSVQLTFSENRVESTLFAG